MLDILIKNGTVIDGTGKAGEKLDVSIEAGKISEVADGVFAEARNVIDATGCFVVPGFIDIQNHSDSYFTLFDQPDQTSLLSQGITTIVIGNCGSSLAPLLSPESIKSIQKWHSLSGINLNWNSVAEFLDILQKQPLGVNVATLVGHATLRRGLVGDSVKPLDGMQLSSATAALREALYQGAFGLSLGLVYAHEVNSSHEELLELTKNLKPNHKYLSVHLRNEINRILESLDEVITLAKETSVPIKISHLKIRGEENWPLFEQAVSKLETAYHQGLHISFDVYPYDSTWGVLYTYLPKWAYEGGRNQILSNLKDKTQSRKIVDFINSTKRDYSKVVVSQATGNKSLIGKSLSTIASNQNVSPSQALVDVIMATDAQVTVFDHNLSTKQVEMLAQSPLSMIATDGAGYSGRGPTLMHPRCFGTFPRFLKMVAEKKILRWEDAIKKITSEPANLLGLETRGRLVKNAFADVVVFNPKTITDKATYEYPDLFSQGIEHVVVNGKLAYTHDKPVGLSGKVLRR